MEIGCQRGHHMGTRSCLCDAIDAGSTFLLARLQGRLCPGRPAWRLHVVACAVVQGEEERWRMREVAALLSHTRRDKGRAWRRLAMGRPARLAAMAPSQAGLCDATLLGRAVAAAFACRQDGRISAEAVVGSKVAGQHGAGICAISVAERMLCKCAQLHRRRP